MSLFNSIASAALGAATGQTQGAGASTDVQSLLKLAGALLDKTGGLQGLLGQLHEGGLKEAVASWVGHGANMPVSGEQLQQALGSDLMGSLAQAVGSNTQATASGLAEVLPGLVDQLTPEGRMPADGGNNTLQALLGHSHAGQVMGMLGGLLKR